MRKVWGSIPWIVKSTQCRQRLATTATFLCYPSAKRWAPVTFAGVGSQHSPSPLTIAEKMKPFFFKTNRLFFMRSLPKLLSCFHPKQHHPPQKHFTRKPFPYKYNDHPFLRLREKLYHPPISVFTTRALIMMQCCNIGTRWSNFSVVFCLKCIFVIDVAVKQLRSRSFLKCGVSAVTMAAHKYIFF